MLCILLEAECRRCLRPAGKRKGSSGVEGILVHDPAMPATRAAKLLRLKLRQEGPQRTHTAHNKRVHGCEHTLWQALLGGSLTVWQPA